jgi:hypothetical protein
LTTKTCPSDSPIPDQFSQPVIILDKEWDIKKEIFLDSITEEWGELISKRALENKFYGILHEKPIMEWRVSPNGVKYQLSSISSSLLDAKKNPNKKEQYWSHMVCCETEDLVITGNFNDLDLAIAWIEGMLE